MAASNTTQQHTDRIETLFQAGAHFGYSKSRRHPSMKPYIYGMKDQIDIIDLEQTVAKLEEVNAYVQSLGKERKQVLFVSSKKELEDVIQNAALASNQPFATGRWIGGTLTNFKQMRSRVDRLESLIEQRDKGELSVYTKYEQVEIDREIAELEETVGGLRPMKKLPAALFIIDPAQEEIAVAEAHKMQLPIIGLCNTDCNAHETDYTIPASDAAVASVRFIVQRVAEAYEAGLKEAPTQKDQNDTQQNAQTEQSTATA
jgi:small subunit ribosomal protein S2